ncbi:triose-phosphate isomerase [Candidatus Woesearchaeota archaeon]|nr:triose-phosphate isomerase [Candidatus Woesearchaeota archaeon]HIH38123.1 triose-phosphate isomerase [Candidatus Woesearchaeota archaeon]HIH49572.1 triose-phosphate isomerase [Candidatus Woesearchaeota archaeon]HIJ04382.1 triose-phosphate isomerase [Candidatus Woesearchaeota archaeon]
MRLFFGGNWKMNKTTAEARTYLDTFLGPLSSYDADIVLFCPYMILPAASQKAKGTPLSLGAQNLYPKPSGAYTGEISPAMVKEFATYVLLGHSERRIYLGETDSFINEKVRVALREDLKVVLCVGETAKERKEGKSSAVVRKQLRACLKDIPGNNLNSIIIAYEPVWAISTFPGAKPAQPADAEEMHALIKGWFTKQYGKETRVIYGGSVKPDNCEELIVHQHIDGFLPGGASLDPESFLRIINRSLEARKRAKKP